VHIQVVNFRLNGMSEEQYRAMCDELASAFASMPGLVSKTWLGDSEAGVYGGVYTWQDKQAMDNYMKSDLFNAVIAHPNLADITSHDFGVLEGPTRVTHGAVAAAV
jgi:quinol monooxygenase YgiN